MLPNLRRGDAGGLPAKDIAPMLTSRLMASVVSVLARSPGAWVPTEALSDAVFADRRDGGPLSAGSSINVAVAKYRHQLRPLGWQIEGRPHCGYRLLADRKA